ncbi:MAG: alpha/beta hydrolase [Ignavibacteriaceae bacterium]|nr:alpha/beta hydrolase [Ignavibacteriaceae bacterium]
MNAAKTFFIFCFLLLIIAETKAQDQYKLWDGEQKPFYKENNLKEYEKESWGEICAFDVTEPTLTVYKAEGINSGKAVVIIPGGGYSAVAIYHEGHDLAKVLAKYGITAAVLKYRLPNAESSDKPELVPLTDARKSLKLLRENAEKYGVQNDQVGVMGFSAGSHLATVVGLWRSENGEENPDFTALIYGVTTIDSVNLKWLEDDLYLRKMTEEEIAKNELINLVTDDTPPAFLIHAYNDNVCKVKETTLYSQKLFEHRVPVEMHLFPRGGHGFGMGRKEDGTDQWVQLFINWLKVNSF